MRNSRNYGRLEKAIKKPLINTFERAGIDYKLLLEKTETATAINRFTGEEVETNALIAYLVGWVYATSDKYEVGNYSIKVSDFDRIRYFILKIDKEVYSKCID